MPVSAPRPCKVCGILVRDGTSRCLDHKVVQGSFADTRRGSRHERGYGSDWDKRRARILARDAGLCQCSDCKARGLITLATEVDHIISKAEWQVRHGSLAGVDDDSNLQAINRECHKRKTVDDRKRVRAAHAQSHLPMGAGALGVRRRTASE